MKQPFDREGPGKADIRAVAGRARVSIATVSRVMNGVLSVDPKLARRVQTAVEELQYRPNTQARGLVSGRSRMIGLIVTLITNPFFPEMIQSFEDEATRRGYDVLIGSTNYSPKRKLECVRRMANRQVDGVAMMTFGADKELLNALAEHSIPAVSVGIAGKCESSSLVQVDFGAGMHEAVQHLAVLGHRRLAFISGPLRVDNSLERQVAFLAACQQAGIRIPKSFLIEADHSMEGGYDAAERLLAEKDRPTAILCSNDMTAIGVLHALSAHGLRVPEDMSVVGFDDIHMAQFTVPPLTTVRMSCQEIAKAAVDLLVAGFEKKEVETPPVVSTRLIVRQTTGYPPGRIRQRPQPAKRSFIPKSKN